MKEKLTEPRLAAWRNFITLHATIIERIDQKLGEAGCIPLHWYDILIELQEAEQHRLRLFELAERVVLTRSTITRLVDKLEAEGLLTRERASSDRRGAYAVLTEKGGAALRKAWPVYAAAIAGYFADHLSDSEADQLVEIFGRMLGAARSGAPQQ